MSIGLPLAAGAALLAMSMLALGAPGLAQPGAVQPSTSGPPTGAFGAADPLFQQPYIDKDEWRDTPVRHHYIHGGFKGTDLKFSYYFPEKAQYQGRFFHHVAAQPPARDDTALDGTGENNKIAFSFASGGYLVESNMGGRTPGGAAITAFRGSAAAADYSRVVAMKLFGGKRPYGYIYGGSGGGFRSMSAMENTTVWDGAVPYVIGSPRAMQLMTNGYDRAIRVLRNKIPQITDALDAGGSGNMYAGLNKDEADALREATRLGYPIGAWPLSATRGPGGGAGAGGPGSLPGTGIDPGYVTDFWSKPGYEGTDPNSYAVRNRVQFPTTAVKILTAADARNLGLAVPPPPPRGAGGGAGGRGAGAPGFVNPVGADFAQPAPAQPAAPTAAAVAIELEAVPAKAELGGAVLMIKSGAAAGQSVRLNRMVGKIAFLTGGAAIVAKIKPGDTIQIDNSDALAKEVILRYQVPSRDYVVWDQYRDKNGKPITPQRPLQPESSICDCGIQNGRFKGKMIVVAAMQDMQAVPWNADWYTQKVKSSLGGKFNDQYRLWFIDNTVHTDSANSITPTRLVPYLGALYQALRDVAAWVEKGVAPPVGTNYRVDDGQIVLPAAAAQRRGVQPVVTLKANGAARADVAVGQAVTFTGVVSVPPGTGKVVAAEWDFDGAGTFPVKGTVVSTSPTQATVTTTHSFTKPGTYFAVLRAISQREGDTATPWGRIRNLARARVIVK